MPAALALVFGACAEDDAETVQGPSDLSYDPGTWDGVNYTAQAPVMQRLTRAQYRNAVADIIGEEIIIAGGLEPDLASNGFLTVGAAASITSPRGVEQYEASAVSIASQAMSNSDVRDRLITCTPAGDVDDACARQTIETLGRRIYRRALTETELDRLTNVAAVAGDTIDDFYEGFSYALAAMLQSPNFLYRVEAGEEDPAGGRRYTANELASRLSFLLWNTTPDDALLDAASDGSLLTDAGLQEQVQRLLADARARDGVDNMFAEYLQLYELEHLSKDPTIFVHMSSDVGDYAREETMRLINDLVFDRDVDFREFYVADYTFINRKLAAIYNIPAPAREGFARAELTEDGGRRGFLGQLSFLALHSHPTNSSPTLRGRFIRETLLCGTVPPPPSNVDTSIPEPSPDARTLRERLEQGHLNVPNCASCHLLMDPLGLGFENFDSLGRWRETENDAMIDPSGDLDGVEFEDAWEFGGLIAEHRNLASCITRNVFRYASGRIESFEEARIIEGLSESFEKGGFQVQELLFDFIMSPGFRKVGAIESTTSN